MINEARCVFQKFLQYHRLPRAEELEEAENIEERGGIEAHVIRRETIARECPILVRLRVREIGHGLV